MAASKIFKLNASHACLADMEPHTKDILTVLGQGGWQLPLIRIFEARERHDGVLKAECSMHQAVRVLNFGIPAIQISAKEHEKQGRALSDDQFYDLCDFFLQRFHHQSFVLEAA